MTQEINNENRVSDREILYYALMDLECASKIAEEGKETFISNLLSAVRQLKDKEMNFRPLNTAILSNIEEIIEQTTADKEKRKARKEAFDDTLKDISKWTTKMLIKNAVGSIAEKIHNIRAKKHPNKKYSINNKTLQKALQDTLYLAAETLQTTEDKTPSDTYQIYELLNNQDVDESVREKLTKAVSTIEEIALGIKNEPTELDIMRDKLKTTKKNIRKLEKDLTKANNAEKEVEKEIIKSKQDLDAKYIQAKEVLDNSRWFEAPDKEMTLEEIKVEVDKAWWVSTPDVVKKLNEAKKNYQTLEKRTEFLKDTIERTEISLAKANEEKSEIESKLRELEQKTKTGFIEKILIRVGIMKSHQLGQEAAKGKQGYFARFMKFLKDILPVRNTSASTIDKTSIVPEPQIDNHEESSAIKERQNPANPLLTTTTSGDNNKSENISTSSNNL